MKRRALSLLLALCLLLSLLPVPSVAEEWVEATVDAAAIVEELPVAEEEPPIVEEEPPVAEEEPSIAEIPGAELDAEADVEAEVETEAEVTPALGTSGVQYAGVAYLSQETFDSMTPEMQQSYIEMVDGFDAEMEAGHAMLDVVFWLKSDGQLGMSYKIPFGTPLLGDGGQEGEADAEPMQLLSENSALPQEEPALPAEESEISPETIELPEEEPQPEAGEESAANAEEPRTFVEENVALAESLRPAVGNTGMAGYLKHMRSVAAKNAPKDESSPQARTYPNTVDESHHYFYDQPYMSGLSKKAYNAAKEAIFDKGINRFTI